MFYSGATIFVQNIERKKEIYDLFLEQKVVIYKFQIQISTKIKFAKYPDQFRKKVKNILQGSKRFHQ